jgi:hypothetical protein
MDNYILNRLRVDAAHLLALADNESALQHQGLKGRFRELLIDNLLSPWLPPYIACGTGMIIAAENRFRESTQDDIIVYDRTLVPPVLVSANHAPEGVFLYNSVLARIEVKSTLTRADVVAFVKASIDIAALKHSVQLGFTRNLEGAFSLLFAYDSDAVGKGDVNFQLTRVIEVMREEGCDPASGVVSMVCIPPYGFWKLGLSEGQRCWQRLTSDKAVDTVVWFVACVSNSCYFAHARRQGRDPAAGLEGGIGMYLPHPFEVVPAEGQQSF